LAGRTNVRRYYRHDIKIYIKNGVIKKISEEQKAFFKYWTGTDF